MPASLQRSPKPIDVHCVPWLLRCISASDRRCQSALFTAPSTSSVRGRDPMDQPATWRFQASTAPAQQRTPPEAGMDTGSGPAGPRRHHAEYPLTPPVLDRTGKLTCLTLTNSKADPALIRSLSEPGHGHLEELAFRARLLVPSSQPPELPPLLGRSARPPCLLHPGRLGTPSCGWILGRRLELPSELFGDYSYIR